MVVGAGGMWWLGVRLPHSAHLWALMNLAAPRTDAPALAALAEHQVAAARRVTSLCETRHVPLRDASRPSARRVTSLCEIRHVPLRDTSRTFALRDASL